VDTFKERNVVTEPSYQARVLHITESPNAESAVLTDGLQEAGAEVEMCGDVYRGLARLGRASERPFHAVLLNLNWLPREEYGFVSQVVRRRLSLPVFVYGDLVETERIAEALSLGALARIEPSRQAIALILAEARKSDRAAAEVAPGTDPGEVARPSRQSDDTGVRVPWQKQDDRPPRTPPDSFPSGMAPVANERFGEGHVGGPIEDGPLLSAEEIRLLLYDETPADASTADPEST
jgi:hypothetical protein